MNSTIRHAAWRTGLILLLGLLAAPAAWATLSFDDVVRLVSAGVSERTILDLADVEGATFDLTVEQVIELKEVGATEEFIRALMETSEGDAEDRAYDAAEDEGAIGDVYDDYDDYDLEDYSTVFLYHYYDPFAYYWYAWPSYYVYYSPFWWSRAGFYYGGAWCRDWWDPWAPCSWYCDDHFGYQHWFGPSHTRQHAERDWHRMRSAFPDRAERERTVWQRAGLVRPAGLTARAHPTWRDAARVRTQALSETGRERQTIRTENRTRRVRGESSTPSRRVYRDRSSDRQRPDTERGIRRERSSAPQRQSTTRSSRGVRSGETTRSSRSERGAASSPAPPSRSSDSRQESARPGRGR